MLSATFVVPAFAGNSSTGNGAQSGKHYTLNLLGKDWDKGDYALITDPLDPNYNPVVKNDNGHRIFVKLDGKTRILLMEGAGPLDFAVLDADGTDGKAIFQLPNPGTVVDDGGTPNDPSDDVVTASNYKVYIRMLGAPQGQADMYSGFFDPVTGDTWVSLEAIELRQVADDFSGNPNNKLVTRKSPSKFEDVTKELTTIIYDIDPTEGVTLRRVNIFDDSLYQYFWDYDNQGLRHVQLRFYPA